MKTAANQGLFLNIIIGIIGAIIGGWIIGFFGQTGVDEFSIYSFLVALLVSIVPTGITKAIRG